MILEIFNNDRFISCKDNHLNKNPAVKAWVWQIECYVGKTKAVFQ